MLIANREQVLAFRLASHNLFRRLPAGFLIQAAGVIPLQNTPPGSAALALHARVEGLTPSVVSTALFEQKTLLQAWSLRGAPHIWPTREASIFTLGLLPQTEETLVYFISGAEPALAQIGITAKELLALTAQELPVVLDGRTLTKDQLGLELAKRISPHLTAPQQAAWQAPSWYAPGQSQGESVSRFVLLLTALMGVCCHGERRANQAFLVRTDQWLGAATPSSDSARAKAEVARHYLHAYGPSSVEDFSSWGGIAQSQAESIWSLVADETVEVKFGGRKAWLLTSDQALFLNPLQPHGVRLLPPHDPYLNQRDRSVLLPNRSFHTKVWRRQVNPGGVLVDGHLVGLWRPHKQNRRMALSIETFEPLGERIVADIETEAASAAPFWGVETVDVSLHPLS